MKTVIEQIETSSVLDSASSPAEAMSKSNRSAEPTRGFYWFLGVLAVYFFVQAITNPTPQSAPT